MNIFVAKLNFDTREDHLKEVFEEFGEVSSAKIIMSYFRRHLTSPLRHVESCGQVL